jgi:hypothetical protein
VDHESAAKWISLKAPLKAGSPRERRATAQLTTWVASRSKWARIEALLRNRLFAPESASARARGRDGASAVFPPGTYWLQRFASVTVLET